MGGASKWIKFVERDTPDGLKTKRWWVVTKEHESILGGISWFGRWRKYTFWTMPAHDAVFEEDCLRDIAAFIEEKTKEHRNANKAAKAANEKEQRLCP